MSEKKKTIVQGKTVELTFIQDKDTQEWAFTAKFPDNNLMGYCKDLDRDKAQKVSIHRLFMALDEEEAKTE
ncbi:hypothetical protein [Bacillus testis]|uniref:hypothetical protein n=1 Tax=Bacillus testis TaxID=1622072 RepID=UPI00067EEF83|nr:hypothetical protein [Bacillus testis]